MSTTQYLILAACLFLGAAMLGGLGVLGGELLKKRRRRLEQRPLDADDVERIIDEFLDMLAKIEGRHAKREYLRGFCKQTGLGMADLWRRAQERGKKE
jgi:hypothetical protein